MVGSGGKERLIESDNSEALQLVNERETGYERHFCHEAWGEA